MPKLENENEAKRFTQAPMKELRACRASMILLIFIAAQIIIALAVGIVEIVSALNHGRNLRDPNELAKLTQIMIPPAAILGIVGSGIAMILASLTLARPQIKDKSSTGAAWLFGSSKMISQGLAIGLLVGLCNLLLATIFIPRTDHLALGPLAQMAMTPGLPQMLWIIGALLFAPPIEELLFRGILYGGYCRSFGPLWAAILTTAVFVICHVTEIIYFVPATVGIIAIAITALWLRLRSSAIGPSVAAHFGYNATIAIMITYSAS